MLKRILLLVQGLFALVVLLVLLAKFVLPGLRTVEPVAFFERFGQYPLVISHADDSGIGLYPGNSMLFLEEMTKLGVDVLEMDVQLTEDGYIVLMHDETVDRTTEGSGEISQMTLAQLRQLNVGYNWSKDGQSYPYRASPLQIPTIEQVFTEFRGWPMIIEIKPSSPELGRRLCETVSTYLKEKEVMVSTRHQHVMDAFRKDCPRVATGATENEVRRFVYASLARLPELLEPEYRALHIPMRSGNIELVNRRTLRHANKLGLQTHVWTVNQEPEMRSLVELGTEGIMTDRPDLLLQVLDR
ncbi:glycerophosphodiester phosphodiesterase [Biformimicrobium ophioploci]|uniref:glycerophosphodiester phosphodiesterase n=1 Tax=Biformimicrobium ophioploci TaxID=3036711 RepID=UPI0025538EA2|nr:glycerophosphodiester phosphodiesterase [Microbulbifer sp. NKW57]